MFVIADMSDERKRIFEKYRKHEIILHRHDVKGCAPFFVAECHKKYTDLNELKSIVERYGVALFPDKADIPQIMKPLSFEAEVLPLKMLVKTVGDYLSKSKSHFDITVSIIDPGAKCCDVICEIASKVRFVRVITNRCDRYDICIRQIFNSLGIRIEVTDDISSANGSDAVICINDSQALRTDCKKVICFNKTCEEMNSTVLLETDARYEKFDSSIYGISPFRLLCALYETCGYHLTKIPLFNAEDIF